MENTKINKIKLNLPNKIILWCVAVELYNINKEHYIHENIGIKEIYIGIKEYLRLEAEEDVESLNRCRTVTLRIKNSIVKKNYDISFTMKEIKNGKKKTNK